MNEQVGIMGSVMPYNIMTLTHLNTLRKFGNTIINLDRFIDIICDIHEDKFGKVIPYENRNFECIMNTYINTVQYFKFLIIEQTGWNFKIELVNDTNAYSYSRDVRYTKAIKLTKIEE